mgnify:FL=1
MEVKSLNTKTEFVEIKRFGKKATFNLITITTLNKTNNDFRIGFKISKKTGKAVFRNKIRRQLRHLFSEVFNKYLSNSENNGLWVLVYINPKIENFDFSKYKSFLEKKFDL